MNVKKLFILALLGILASASAACNSANITPTRTPKAVADNGNPTQTPWIIYMPVTVTPEPFTVTPLPTVTSSQPTPKPTNTRATKPVTTITQPTAIPPTAAALPPPIQPTATQAAACGQTYQVIELTFPVNGTQRETKAGGGAGKTIQFKWTAVDTDELDPKIGYQVFVKSPKNSAVLYISHNGYLKVMNDNGAILSQQATWGLTNGDDVNVQWNVTVVYASGGFDDQSFNIFGTPTTCGPASPWSTVYLKVVQ